MRGMKLVCAGVLVAFAAVASAKGPAETKIPVTTKSAEARELYLKGRDHLEKLRITDARKLFEQAVEKDKDFALGWVGLANTAGGTKEFFDAVQRAVASAPTASPAEQLVVAGLEAGSRGDLAKQKSIYVKLVGELPRDERAQLLLGAYYFGQQEYAAAIPVLETAVKIDATFAAPYNQLGYAYRFMVRYPEAEATFKKYIELIPNDPNPYDSYGELLMKLGRYDESIKSYEKALAIDPNFVASYIGIGHDHMFAGRFADARAAFAKLDAKARRANEHRQAIFWTTASYAAEASWAKASAEAEKLTQLSTKAGDQGQLANDLQFEGVILLEAGKPDAAAAKFKAQLEATERATLPADVKATTRRNALFAAGRVAIAKRDLAAAKARLAEYATQVAVKKVPFEVKNQHELAGMIAIETKDWKTAIAELAEANQRDPRVLYLQAVALAGAGDPKARDMAKRAAEFNELGFNWVLIHRGAKALLAAKK
jgi:tetratricopeptide (TPR) repeat protein